MKFTILLSIAFLNKIWGRYEKCYKIFLSNNEKICRILIYNQIFQFDIFIQRIQIWWFCIICRLICVQQCVNVDWFYKKTVQNLRGKNLYHSKILNFVVFMSFLVLGFLWWIYCWGNESAMIAWFLHQMQRLKKYFKTRFLFCWQAYWSSFGYVHIMRFFEKRHYCI